MLLLDELDGFSHYEITSGTVPWELIGFVSSKDVSPSTCQKNNHLKLARHSGQMKGCPSVSTTRYIDVERLAVFLVN